VDPRREHIAVKEAKKLGVTTIALIDTDGDPDLIDLPIPGNDDAMRAIELIVRELADAVIEGKQTRPEKGGEDQSQQPRRRSARSQFRAEEQPEPEQPQQPVAAAAPPPPEQPPVEQAPVESYAAQSV
jgi:small subunit ribosomal protein S2